MQNIEVQDILQKIHEQSVDNVPHPQVECRHERPIDFIRREVWRDVDTGKWRFMGKEYKRQGQAEKAALRYFRGER